VLADPTENFREAEFMALHGAVDEVVASRGFHFDVAAVTAQEDVGGGEGDALISVEEAVVVAERLHQRGCLFFERVVVAGLRTENGGLDRTLVADAVQASEHVDEPVLHLVDFRDR